MKEKVMVQSRMNRVLHWLFALSVLMLMISGFYINRPVNLGDVFSMDKNILLQTGTAFIATGIFTVWVYYYIVTESFREILFRRRDLADFKGLLKYYFFLTEKPPAYGKYNSGQRLVYTSWFFVFLFMLITGLIMYLANFGNILPFAVGLQKIRFYHFLGALWFLGTVPLHIYLSLTEDPAKMQAILTGWLKK